jgi:hypothetical protein
MPEVMASASSNKSVTRRMIASASSTVLANGRSMCFIISRLERKAKSAVRIQKQVFQQQTFDPQFQKRRKG